ncbi:uncharacterized protein LOC143027587 [Oratosquilla oratoria]|uniref:uncharacterized protein LOC143027587 n=1 Tax=Oratosquilla oratoria TaxID=337810 RepID=UPI003F773F5D
MEPQRPASPSLQPHQNQEQSNQPIPYEDLGITRRVAMRPSIIGNVRTLQNLSKAEYILLIFGIISALATCGLGIDRLIALSPGSSDYVFAIVLIFNAGFSVFYVLDGVLREQAFELMAFVISSVILITYVTINYIQQSASSDTFKLVRLIVTTVFGVPLAILGARFFWEYLQSGYLIFRTVGADSNIQAMCRTLLTTMTLIVFDIQVLGNVVVLAIHDGVWSLDTEEIITISLGFPFILAWGMIAYLAIRLESKYFFTVAALLSPAHIVYMIFAVVQTALKHLPGVVAHCQYAACALAILVHVGLLVFMVRCWYNFDYGLKEKVFPRSQASTNQL